MAAYGASPEAVDQWTQARNAEPEDVQIYHCNRETLRVWLMLETQWKRDLFSGAWLGLDYAAIDTVHRLAGLTCSQKRFADLREMEATALPILNRKS
ncbi:DUF1799 domain-containing protein [Arhodomonas sp. AD133]|uniref:DUF1799 domain-containing protein n=1 Tax=Arhodomonas sp. AD133 TaxID=3415009 RepID=UPI003EBC6B2C